MRLFHRIFLGHLLTILVASLSFAAVIGLISPEFYRQQLDGIFLLVTSEQAWLRVSLEEGQQRVMLLSLLVSLPVAALVAAGTAYLETRRVVAAVRRLAEGSREIAKGRYGQRLEAKSNDELGAIALHFNKMAETLEGADRSRAQVVSVVAHELKTPLSTLRSYAEALEDGVVSRTEAAHAVTREVNALHRIADDLLLVARVEANEIGLRCVPCSPEDLLGEAWERFVHAFEDENVEFRRAEVGALPNVHADRERVAQVLGNLLSNALVHTPAGGRVALGAFVRGDAVAFFVQDSGPGISPDHQPHLFKRFYQVDLTSSRKGRRLGVGLTIAQGLVEAMGGSIWVKSELGRGSTFFFSLPQTLEGSARRTAGSLKLASNETDYSATK